MHEQPRLNFSEGERRKKTGIARVSSNTSDWQMEAREQIRCLADAGAEFTSEDLRGLVPEPPSPNAWGAAFSVMEKKGVIERVRMEKAKRSKAHSRWIAVWRRCG